MLGHDVRSSFTNRGERAISPETAHTLGALWTFDAPGQVYGAPAVADGVVYATSTGGLLAFDGDTGAVRWERPDVRATSSPTLRDGTLFVHDLGATLRALDAATGDDRWEVRTDAHPLATGLSSPVVLEDFVIVGISSNELVREGATFRGGVAAYDRETGAPRWRDFTARPPHNGAAVWSTVSIDPATRTVFAASGQNYTGEAGPRSDAIFALDLDTGVRRWTTQTVEGDVFTPINPTGGLDADFGANPILFEAVVDGARRRLVGAGQKHGMFWALDRATGAIVWERRLGPGSPLTGGVLNNGAFDGERILVANNDIGAGHGTLFALRPADGSIAWQRPLPGWVWAPITTANGVVFVAADTDLYGVDAETGADLFIYPTEGTIACGASVAGGRVHVGSGMQHIVGTVDRTFHVLGLPDDPGGGGTPPDRPGPTGAPSFPAIYEEVFVGQGCSTPLCHAGGAGGLPMRTLDETHAALVGAPADGACGGAGRVRVVPGAPDDSLLWSKLASRTPPCGEPMPIASSLPDAMLEQIRLWIELGAAREPPEGPVGGEERPVEVLVPPDYDGRTPRPLLLMLHSFTISGEFAELVWQLGPVAAERGVLYAVPEGLRDANDHPYWNSTSACCDRDGVGVDDSAYLRRVIEDVQARYNVDERRIFTVGLSNGGFMGHRLACDHADLIAGIVSIAGAPDIDASTCQPSQGVHVWNIHATEDMVIRFEGGSFFGAYPGAFETVDRWLDHNGCSGVGAPGAPVDADATREGAETTVTRYDDGCVPGGSVELWEMQGSNHYFVPTADFRAALFDYIETHPKP